MKIIIAMIILQRSAEAEVLFVSALRSRGRGCECECVAVGSRCCYSLSCECRFIPQWQAVL